MFLMALLLKRVGFKKLLIFCSLAYLIRMIITAFIGTVDGLIYVQLLQGLTYAVLIPISMSYMSKILDERVRSTAVTTYAAVTVSLNGIIGNLITTSLLTAGFSAQVALLVFAGLALIGFLIVIYGMVQKIW